MAQTPFTLVVLLMVAFHIALGQITLQPMTWSRLKRTVAVQGYYNYTVPRPGRLLAPQLPQMAAAVYTSPDGLSMRDEWINTLASSWAFFSQMPPAAVVPAVFDSMVGIRQTLEMISDYNLRNHNNSDFAPIGNLVPNYNGGGGGLLVPPSGKRVVNRNTRGNPTPYYDGPVTIFWTLPFPTVNGTVKDSATVMQDSFCFTDVTSQGACSACWAFSVGQLMTMSFCHYGILNVTDSSQVASIMNLMDCASSCPNSITSSPNAACYQSDFLAALDYILGNRVTVLIPGGGVTRGLMTLGDYPAELSSKGNTTSIQVRGTSGNCHFRQDKAAYWWGPSNSFGAWNPYELHIAASYSNELQMAQLLSAGYGPLVVGIYLAKTFTSLSNTTGVYRDTTCLAGPLDHMLLVVGYGTASEGTPYWHLKNSFGTAWGTNGFAFVLRNISNSETSNSNFYGYGMCRLGSLVGLVYPPHQEPPGQHSGACTPLSTTRSDCHISHLTPQACL